MIKIWCQQLTLVYMNQNYIQCNVLVDRQCNTFKNSINARKSWYVHGVKKDFITSKF